MTDQTAASNDIVIFCHSTKRLIENVPQGTDPAKLIEALKPRYGDQLDPLPFDEAYALFEAGFKSGPEEISAERFEDALNVLPPAGWKTDSDGECFRMCERLAGTITAIFVRIGTRYVTFQDDIRTPHRECCRRAADYLSQHPVTTAQ